MKTTTNNFRIRIAINDLNVSVTELEKYANTDNRHAVEYWRQRVNAACDELERIGDENRRKY